MYIYITNHFHLYGKGSLKCVQNWLNFHLLIFVKRVICLSDELRKVCWSGIPRKYRPIAWKTLSVSDQNIVVLPHRIHF